MTKSEIEKLIEYLQSDLPKCVHDEGITCKVTDVFKLLRGYPVDEEKTCAPDYQGMYEVCSAKLEKTRAHVESLKFDMHNLSIEHAHYAGAVAAMETIFGRKFDPQR